MSLQRVTSCLKVFKSADFMATAEVSTTGVRYAVWSPDGSHVALLLKHVLIICTRKLEQVCLVHETIRIKSGAWDGNDIFYFTTLNHVKYCLTNGDTGIIRTLDVPLYLTAASNGSSSRWWRILRGRRERSTRTTSSATSRGGRPIARRHPRRARSQTTENTKA